MFFNFNIKKIVYLLLFWQIEIFCSFFHVKVGQRIPAMHLAFMLIVVVVNRVTQDTFLLCHTFYNFFWDLKSVMDRFVSHHNPLKYESMSFESIFTLNKS